MTEKVSNSAAATDPLIGITVDDYKITALVGVGGMARVYEAYDEQLGRRVALKVLSTPHDENEEMSQRFWREARTLAKLDHPHIVTMYRVGQVNQSYYICMKFVDGKTLLTMLKRLRQQKKYLDPKRIVSILEDVAAALDYAHSQGIIHRDIKPSNIMLTTDDRAILADFGLTMQSESESTLGTAFGTPRYIAPEQAISSHRAVPQSDIYSLGVVLFEMVTGQAPFDNDSPMSLALSHITNPPPPPTTIRSDVPEAVEQVILKALQKKPEERYQTAGAMVAALRAAYEGAPLPIEPPIISQPSNPIPNPPKVEEPVSSVSPAAITPHTIIFPPAERDALLASNRFRGVRRLFGYTLVTLLVGLLTLLAAWALINITTPVTAESAFPNATAIPPRVRLIYSKDWFSIYNPTGRTLSLRGITFARGDRSTTFDPAKFLSDQALGNFGDGQCLRVGLQRGDDQTAPFVCGPQNRVGYMLDPNARFWLPLSEKDATFLVLRDQGQTILQTCQLALNTCEFSLP